MRFEEVKGRFGFGCMRLPMNGEQVDKEEFCKMIDKFIDAGLNYFDTAHPYLKGQSELAIGECLSGRYPREKFLLANKLSENMFNSTEEIRPVFEEQLKACKVDYFDFYLMHAQNDRRYERYKELKAFDVARQLKAEGKIKHLGFSFHDTADVLDRMLSEQEGIEFVQIQFNYIDFEDDVVQSRKCYEVCVKHGVPVTVMEPVKGGKLVNIPDEAKKVYDDLNGGSYASYALRFCWSFDNIHMVLSGMGSEEMMNDNLSTAVADKPLSSEEKEAINKVVEIIKAAGDIPCTNCRYCVDGCPMQIVIPDYFALYNEAKRYGMNEGISRRVAALAGEHGVPSNCIECGQCEVACPQHLPIRDYLKKVAETIE